MLTVAAHQPAYLPWLGYFHKIAACDLFVVMDDLQFESQNFQNRNRVKVNNGVAWLTAPLKSGSRGQEIRAKQICDDQGGRENWRRRTWLTLKTHYGRAPYFDVYADELESVFNRVWTSLLDLDLHLMQLMMKWLGIERPMVLASELGLSGRKTGRIVELCRKVGADFYLSGCGGSVDYLEAQQFAEAGIGLAWQDFRHPVYPQRYPSLGFVPNLSALDLILNCGPRGWVEHGELESRP
jgi:hypothetical protein